MKLERGVGFSKGCDGVGVEKTAAIGSQFLDGFLGGNRSHGDLHFLGVSWLTRARHRCVEGLKFWITPWETRTSAATREMGRRI